MGKTPSELAFAELRKRLQEDPQIPAEVRDSLPTEVTSDQPVDLRPFMVAVIQQAKNENNAADGAKP